MWRCPSVDVGRQHFSFYVFPKLTSLSSTLEKCNFIFNIYQSISWSNVGCAFHIHFLLPIWISLLWVVFYSWHEPVPIWHQVLTKHTFLMFYTCFAISTAIFSSCSTLLWLLDHYNLSTSVPIMCPSSHHNSCAVGTGFGGLVSGTM
jgi:hypothetical protein